MSTKDTTGKLFFMKKEVVAELFNYCLFNSDEVIRPENLRETEAAQYKLSRAKSGKKEKTLDETRFRDLLYEAQIEYEGLQFKVLLGVEIQSSVDPHMPVRMYEYNANQYMLQAQSDYIRENDGLVPVWEILVNFSGRAWNKELCLQNMFPNLPPRFSGYLPIYQMHIYDPHKIPDSILQNHNSELCFVAKIFRAMGNEQEIRRIIAEEKPYGGISHEAVDLLIEYLPDVKDISILTEDEGMRTALQQMKQDWIDAGQKIGREEGREEGRKEGRVEGKKEGRIEGRMEGRKEGRIEGRKEGRKKGRMEGIKTILVTLLKDAAAMNDTLSDVARRTQRSINELKALAEENHLVLRLN